MKGADGAMRRSIFRVVPWIGASLLTLWVASAPAAAASAHLASRVGALGSGGVSPIPPINPGQPGGGQGGGANDICDPGTVTPGVGDLNHLGSFGNHHGVAGTTPLTMFNISNVC
jgi:hypothetical protein